MLQSLTLDQMRVFAAVAEAGSFRAAAARLSRVQSAISHAIANLEAELGVVLFDRAGHRPALTGEGRALLEDVRAILLHVDRLKGRARGFNDGVEIALSFVADPLFPIARLTQALHAMHARFPSVRVTLAVEPLGAPLTALKAGRADLAISVGDEFRDPEIEFEAIGTVAMQAVAAAGHRLAGRAEPVTVADLAGHLQVVISDPTTWSEGSDYGVLSPETWRVQSQAAKHAFILDGIGWGRLPEWLIEADLDTGRLVRLDAPALGPRGECRLTAYLARRGDYAPGPAARVIREALRRSPSHN
jgi:DNA-binding transcriptional LysR family regulator